MYVCMTVQFGMVVLIVLAMKSSDADTGVYEAMQWVDFVKVICMVVLFERS